MASTLKRKGKVGKLDILRYKGIGEILDSVLINGEQIRSAEDCAFVKSSISLAKLKKRTEDSWNELMASNGAPSFNDLDSENPIRIVANWTEQITNLLDWYGTKRHQLISLMPQAGMPVDPILRESSLDSEEKDIERTMNATSETIPHLCELSLAINKLHRSEQAIRAAKDNAMQANQGMSSLLDDMIEAMNSLNKDSYKSAYDGLARAYAMRKPLSERVNLLKKIGHFAPQWAKAVHDRAGIHGASMPPKEIREAWKWMELTAKLNELNKTPLDELQKQALSLSVLYREKTRELAECLAWMHLLRKTELNIDLKQALQGWRLTMKKIGKGTGKRAPRLKAEARKKMASCQPAVPAWIMPMSKALESLNPASNKFDIVIVDEASQSSVAALSIAYFAKKIIIVGDDKQVSPMGIGISDDKADALIETHIKGVIPNDYLYTPKTSLYDIAATSFQPLMLREHFRCMPEIIGFSNMLSYDFKIKPLRDPGSSNLLPAIVTHRVENGIRIGKTNAQEAEEIIFLLLACLEQPEYENKTFGIISLLGDDQVKLIQQLLYRHGGEKEIEKRRILCGNASHFQGDERDVIFLSMVDSGENEGVLRKMGYGQDDSTRKRYNVATSRAKDQLWVVHSLDPSSNLKPGDIRGELLSYASDPSAFARSLDEVTRKADSPFEEAVGQHLIARGYQIAQQWEVGSYRIDIVALCGNKRVAIECDGERWHSGEQKIREDMERQAILERVGWRFIRIRGSEYYRDPSATMKRVCKELTELGIEPQTPECHLDSSDKFDLVRRVRACAQAIREKDGGKDIQKDSKDTANSQDVLFALKDHTFSTEAPDDAVPESSNPTIRIVAEGNQHRITPLRSTMPPQKISLRPSAAKAPSKEKVDTQQRPLTNLVESKTSDERASSSPDKDPLVESIEDEGLEFVDKRTSGGCLWVIGGKEISGALAKVKQKHRVSFTFCPDGGRASRWRQAWFTNDRIK